MSDIKGLYKALRLIYGKPASVTLIHGDWKSGKTNFALYLGQLLCYLGIVSKVGANIQVYKGKYRDRITEQNDCEFINNFFKLNAWGFGSEARKLYIFDEAIKNAPSRSAMTKLNKKWLEIIPEASKMRMHVIAIAQTDDYMESVFMNPRFNQAVWEKKTYPERHANYRKMVTLTSKPYFQETLEFGPIPPTSMSYDPYLSARMTIEPEADLLSGLPLEVRIAFECGHGKSTEDLKHEYGLPTRKQAMREVRKGIVMLERSCLVSSNLRWVYSKGKMTQLTQS